MPPGAESLSVGVQALGVVLWALVDPNTAEREENWFRICGTGHPTAPDDTSGFLGTVQFLELVFHVFQEWPLEEQPAALAGEAVAAGMPSWEEKR